jgi:hypothetical protein
MGFIVESILWNSVVIIFQSLVSFQEYVLLYERKDTQSCNVELEDYHFLKMDCNMGVFCYLFFKCINIVV